MLTLFLVFIALWSLIVFFITILDLLNLLGPKDKILPCFSLIRNYKTISQTPAPAVKVEKGKIQIIKPDKILDGIRGLSHVGILLFHLTSLIFMPNDNHNGIVKPPLPVAYSVSVFGRYAFSLFFMMNGVSSAKWFCYHFKSGKVKSNAKLITRFFIERVVSFVPIYYIFLVFFVVYVQYFVTEKSYDEIVIENCKNSLIPNMLFISNLINTDIMCVNWNWTISVLFQLTLITPIFIYAFKRNLRFGIISVVFGHILFGTLNFYIFYSHGFTTESLVNDVELRNFALSSMAVPNTYLDIIHMKPYTYACAYINGIFLGYLIEYNLLKPILGNRLTETLYKITMFILSVTIAICYGRGIFYGGLPFFSALESGFYIPLISFVCCMWFYGINTRNNFFAAILRSNIWSYIRRISRISYLIHPVVFTHLLDLTLFDSNILMNLSKFFSILFINLYFSFILTLSIEMPILRLVAEFLKIF